MHQAEAADFEKATKNKRIPADRWLDALGCPAQPCSRRLNGLASGKVTMSVFPPTRFVSRFNPKGFIHVLVGHMVLQAQQGACGNP